jgi:NADPH-dependent 2,4-dienoyl-CoA reductase/sulfur reductase-like enzyme
VRTGHEVTAIDREAKQVQVRNLDTGDTYTETYDKLVLSLGAVPIRPRLPGIDHPSIFVLRNIPDMDAIMARLGPIPSGPLSLAAATLAWKWRKTWCIAA